MIDKPTVLILGAGAARDYGFPLGRKLRDLVCEKPNKALYTEFEKIGFEADELDSFIYSLRHSAYTSVDWYLEDHRKLISIGKAAISAALIPFEDPDMLFPPKANSDHWYELLLNTLDTPQGAFPENKLSIVTFNYDRSLEYYLYRVLGTRRGSERSAIEELCSMDIIHVHGTLGGLPFMGSGGKPYEVRIDHNTIRTAAEQIIVVGEASDDSDEFKRARNRLSEAERIVFLGFGYHQESVRRLGIFNEPWDEERRQKVRVGGTAAGIPTHRWEKIKNDILNEAMPPRYHKQSTVHHYLTIDEPLDL